MAGWDRRYVPVAVLYAGCWLRCSDADFRDFLLVLRHTGCRPQEARHCDFKAAKIKFAKGDVPGKPWEREIPLNDTALGILQRRALKYPEGELLRNTEGGPWTKSSLNDRFQRLKGKLPFRVSCYVARHSFATDLLDAGASAGAVAAILGHRDPTMVLKVYGKHIDQREEHLRECIEKGTKKYRSALVARHPHGLNVIGRRQPKPTPKSKPRKRDAG